MTRAEILAEVGEGLYVQSVTGVHSGVNPVSGDFSVGAEGLMIRGGELAEPVREVTVASTLQRMLQSVVHIGGDVEWLPGVAAGQTLAVARHAAQREPEARGATGVAILSPGGRRPEVAGDKVRRSRRRAWTTSRRGRR